MPPYHVFLPTWISYESPACAGLRYPLYDGEALLELDVSREEEWQFPSQIMPVVRDTVAHAGFKITKVTTPDLISPSSRLNLAGWVALIPSLYG